MQHGVRKITLDDLRLPLHQIQNKISTIVKPIPQKGGQSNNSSFGSRAEQSCESLNLKKLTPTTPEKGIPLPIIVEKFKQKSYLQVYRQKSQKYNSELTKNTLFQITQSSQDDNENIRKDVFIQPLLIKSIMELKKLAGKFSDLHTLKQFEQKRLEQSDYDFGKNSGGQNQQANSPQFSKNQQNLNSFALLENYLDKINENKEEIDNFFGESQFRNSQPQSQNTEDIKQLDFYRTQNVKLKRLVIQLKLQMLKYQLILTFRKSKIEEYLTTQRAEVKQIIDSYQGFIDKLMNDKKSLSKQCESMSMNLRMTGSASNQEMSVIVTDGMLVSQSIESQALQGEIKQLQLALEQRERFQRDNQFDMEKQLEDKYVKEIESLRELIRQQILKNTLEYTELLSDKDKMICHLREENQSLSRKILEVRMEGEKIKNVPEQLESKLLQLDQLMFDFDLQKEQAHLEMDRFQCETNHIKVQYEKQILELKKQNDVDFQKFEDIVRETIQKKDDCIDKLNRIVNQKLN